MCMETLFECALYEDDTEEMQLCEILWNNDLICMNHQVIKHLDNIFEQTTVL